MNIEMKGIDKAFGSNQVLKNAGFELRDGEIHALMGAGRTEIMQAIALGLDIVKFFPANVYGGLSAIKALSGPFPQIKFLPTGGVDLSNINEFLAFDKIVAVGGSFMMKGDIVANCKKLMEVIAQ